MKILLTVLLVVAASAAACALDLGHVFGRRELPAAPAVPVPAPVPGEAALPLNIPPAEAAALIEAQHPVVIDIRRPEEYAAGRLAAASLHLDYYAPDFKDRLAKLDKGPKYLIYCRSGHRSGLALQLMKELGFTDAHDIAGGINAWTAAGLPVVK